MAERPGNLNPEGYAVSKSDSQYIAEYTCCQSSSKKLKAPIVISRYGKLYNKESVIEYLVNKPKNQKLEDIKSMKDFWSFEPHPNPSYVDPDEKAKKKHKSETKKDSVFPFACPVTGLEMNGRYKFVYGLESKAVVSEQAVRECNMALFPAKFQTGSKQADLGADELHPLFDPKNEELLMCPSTNKKFGRPIQCYPFTKAEKDRAKEFTPTPAKKEKKKKKKSVSEDADSNDSPLEKRPKKQDSCSSGNSSKMASPANIPRKSPKGVGGIVRPAGLGGTPYHDAKTAASLNKNKQQEGVPSTPFTPARGGEGPSFNRYR